jgi:hypothetical protein
MVQDHLTETVLRRLDELGLPLSLIELGEFRHHFFQDGWVMFVRDHDKVANVHLVQPPHRVKMRRRC